MTHAICCRWLHTAHTAHRHHTPRADFYSSAATKKGPPTENLTRSLPAQNTRSVCSGVRARYKLIIRSKKLLGGGGVISNACLGPTAGYSMLYASSGGLPVARRASKMKHYCSLTRYILNNCKGVASKPTALTSRCASSTAHTYTYMEVYVC